MSQKDELLEEIDAAAFRLLRKIGAKDTMSTEASDILVGEIKAFGEIVKYAEVRADLMPKDGADAKFAKMKDAFHAAGRTPRSRRAAGAPAAQIRSSSPALSLISGGDAEPDAGTDEDE